MQRNVSLWVKLQGFAIAVSLLLLGVGLAAYRGLTSAEARAEEERRARSLGVTLHEKEIAHLEWVSKASQFLWDSTQGRLAVEKDERRCGFGQWYYGPERAAAEAAVPSLAPLLARMAEPHRRLHASARGIEGFLTLGPPGRAHAVAHFARESVPQLAALRALLRSARGEVDARMVALGKAGAAEATATGRAVFWLVIAGALIAAVLGAAVARSLVGPLRKGVAMMRELSAGRLGARLALRRRDELGQLSLAMDAFADHLQNVVVAALRRIEEGDVHVEVPEGEPGDEIAPALRGTVDSLRALLAEVRTLSEAATAGHLGVRAGTERLQGSYREILEGLNGTLDALLSPVEESRRVLDRIAARDLTARVEGTYAGDHERMKRAVNLAAENLHDGLAAVAQAAGRLDEASTQVAQSAESLASGTTRQAQSLATTADNIERLAAHTAENAQRATEANDLSRKARASSDTGVESMRDMVAAMAEIRASAEATAQIIRDINDVAFQTNLLALNAAVEAARAGDAGRGFAVVAEEVRNLALRAKEAAKKTESLIGESVRWAERGEGLCRGVNANLAEIVTHVGGVGGLIDAINGASSAQASDIARANAALAQIDEGTRENASAADELSGTAEEISAQATDLAGLVARFGIQLSDARDCARAENDEGRARRRRAC